MLQEEAEEISDAELSDSSYEAPRPWLRGNFNQSEEPRHRSSKAIAFVTEALTKAAEGKWDDAELAKLVVLFIQTMNLKHRAAWSFLNKTCVDMVTPTFLSKLKDEGLRVTAENVLTILQMTRCPLDKLVSTVSECVDEHVLSLRDEDTLELLATIGEDSMTEEQRVQYIARLCEHCNTKKSAGRVVNAFTKLLPLEDATSLVHEVVELDFFLDLKGKMKSFYKQFGDRRADIEARVQAIAEEQGHTELASDEDQDGNLRDFVVDDEEPVIDDLSGSEEEPSEVRKRLKKRKVQEKRQKKRRHSDASPAKPVPAAARKRRVVAPDDDDSDF